MHGRNTLYSVLQVLPDADPDVIEAAYKALMKRYHPDRLGGVDDERRAAAISHAFSVLRDPDRRAAYDAEEKVREERNRVDLVRAFPEGAAGAAGRFDQPRPSHPVSTWIGAAGILILVVTIILLARGASDVQPSGGSSAAKSLAPGDADAAGSGVASAARPVPFRDQAVSRHQVIRAVTELRDLSAAGGLPAAAEFSEQCFEAQARSLDVDDFDFCVAFDHAAGRLEPEAAAERRAARRFQPPNQVTRHVRAADPIADTFSSIELRLFEIRRLADAVLTEFDAETAASMAPNLTPPPVNPDSGRRIAASRSTPKARKGRDEDFLERQGGIY